MRCFCSHGQIVRVVVECSWSTPLLHYIYSHRRSLFSFFELEGGTHVSLLPRNLRRNSRSVLDNTSPPPQSCNKNQKVREARRKTHVTIGNEPRRLRYEPENSICATQSEARQYTHIKLPNAVIPTLKTKNFRTT